MKELQAHVERLRRENDQLRDQIEKVVILERTCEVAAMLNS